MDTSCPAAEAAERAVTLATAQSRPDVDRIRARLASSDGLANQATITISICYCIED